MREIKKSDEFFDRQCANYEENYRRFRVAYQKNYAVDKALGEFKENIKESAADLASKIDELFMKQIAGKNTGKVPELIREFAELMLSITQCFDAKSQQEVIMAFDRVKNLSVKLMENKTREEKILLGAASPLKEKIKSAAILFVGVLALGVLAFGLSTLIFATAGTAVAVGGIAAAAISLGAGVASAASIAISTSLIVVGAGLAGLSASKMGQCYTSFLGKTGLCAQLDNFHSVLNKNPFLAPKAHP